MPTVSSGASVEYDITINTRFEVSTLGEAYVDALSGPIATGGESVRVMPGREYRRGPYTVPCRVRVRCISGEATYGGSTEPVPVMATTGPGGGSRLLAGNLPADMVQLSNVVVAGGLLQSWTASGIDYVATYSSGKVATVTASDGWVQTYAWAGDVPTITVAKV